MADGLDDLRRHLRPGDEQFVRGVDPTTAGLTLMAVATLRRLVEQMFPWTTAPEGADERNGHG